MCHFQRNALNGVSIKMSSAMDDVHIISIKSEFCDEKAARPFGGEFELVYLPPETNGGCCFYRFGCRLSPRRPTGSGSAVRRVPVWQHFTV